MNRRESTAILRRVLSLPTAPFAEGHVLEFIRSFVADRPALKLRTDVAGNLLIHYREGKPAPRRPVCLTAHVDHPGFVAERASRGGKLLAVWRGGVMPEYFVGSGVRFFSGGAWVRGKVATIRTVRKGPRRVVKNAIINMSADVAEGSPGMWDFGDPTVRGRRIHARAIDDLAGVAAQLACLHDLAKRRPRGEGYFLFTRAEEVGFIGAMAACRAGTIPKRCVVVAIETSSERRHARMGDGPILRVGDKTSTFTSSATAFAGVVASDLAKSDKRFRFQRRLMDGGTCESSAFCALGYEATGICLALGNYHNMNVRTGRIGAEYIDLDDFTALVAWFIALVETKRRYDGRDGDLDALLERLRREYDPLLTETAARRK